MSRVTNGLAGLTGRFPRVSGDEPVEDGVGDFGPGFSPRERG